MPNLLAKRTQKDYGNYNYNYSIIAWGYQSGRVMLIQKKCLGTITRSKMFAHSDPLFKAISILKIEDTFFKRHSAVSCRNETPLDLI